MQSSSRARADKFLETYRSYLGSRLTTTFIRFFKGLNLFGMLSHVLRPIMTALDDPSGAWDVTRAKYAISCGNRQGSVALWPIPFDFVAATIRVKDIFTG